MVTSIHVRMISLSRYSLAYIEGALPARPPTKDIFDFVFDI